MVKETDQMIKKHSESKSQLPYKKPTLQCFGLVSELTQSGSGTRTEQETPEGCSADLKRKPCQNG